MSQPSRVDDRVAVTVVPLSSVSRRFCPGLAGTAFAATLTMSSINNASMLRLALRIFHRVFISIAFMVFQLICMVAQPLPSLSRGKATQRFLLLRIITDDFD